MSDGGLACNGSQRERGRRHRPLCGHPSKYEGPDRARLVEGRRVSHVRPAGLGGMTEPVKCAFRTKRNCVRNELFSSLNHNDVNCSHSDTFVASGRDLTLSVSTPHGLSSACLSHTGVLAASPALAIRVVSTVTATATAAAGTHGSRGW